MIWCFYLCCCLDGTGISTRLPSLVRCLMYCGKKYKKATPFQLAVIVLMLSTMLSDKKYDEYAVDH